MQVEAGDSMYIAIWNFFIKFFFFFTWAIPRGARAPKNYVDRETVPIPSYPPTIEAVSEYLDREYW